MRWFKKNKSLQIADQLKLEHAQFEIDPWAYNRTLKEAADARRILAEEEEIRLKPIMEKVKAEQKRLALIEQEREDRYQRIEEDKPIWQRVSGVVNNGDDIARLTGQADLLSDFIVRTQYQLRLAESENIPGIERLISYYQKSLAESIHDRQKILDLLVLLRAQQ